MADQWYYAWGKDRQGPFSAEQLVALAEAGSIQPTDMVWKAGVEQGVAAARVQHLFPPVHENDGSGTEKKEVATDPHGPALTPLASQDPSAPATPPAAAPAAQTPDLKGGSTPEIMAAEAANEVKAEESKPPEKANPPRPQLNAPKKGRASAILGAMVVSQDGTTVNYRKKCTKCGHEDTAKNRMVIRNGITRVTFFCPKCRKLMKVEIQGNLG